MKTLIRAGTLALITLALAAGAAAQTVKLGAGTYWLSPRRGDAPAPPATFRTEAMLKQAAPTNQWYSSLIFSATPEVIYAQPLTFKATPAGLEMALATRLVLPTDRRDVEIHYPHRDPLLISPVAFASGPARLAQAGDWSIDIEHASGADRMLSTIAHGSPYAYVQISRGDVRVTLPAAGERFATGAGADPRVLALRVKGLTYALFGPTGVRWEAASPTEWIGRLPAGRGYVSVAALPDEQPATLQLFTRHAYAFVTGTRVEWNFDAAHSRMATTFRATTRAMEGDNATPLMGLYPHQWFNNPTVADQLGPTFDTLRGKIRLIAAPSFSTTRSYSGFVPMWPGVADSGRGGDLRELMKTDVRKRRELLPDKENIDDWRTSAYWQGKGLQRITQLMAVVEAQGDTDARDQLLKLTRERMEWWFSGAGRSYFHYDKQLGTVVTYPDEFFAVQQMNDHHFHYGYWIRVAAEIALRDPAWAAREQWGGMVELLVSDIATAQRGRADFPFLRNFDPYEGHSWASGIGLGPYGNNQESSSEAVNAWAALIVWAEATGNRELRDLGIYLYTTEIDAINHYWFDIHHLVLAPEYKNVEVSMLFGGKYAHNTWWTDEPRQIKGINLLPVTTASTYLATDPAFIKRSLGTLQSDMAGYAAHGKKPNNPPPADIWQDVFAKTMALADPAEGLSMWDRWGSFEMGDTRSHALHWMLSLADMGQPDLSVTADTTLFSVFRRADGSRTYLAYNATRSPINVRFSDGKVLSVAPGALAKAR